MQAVPSAWPKLAFQYYSLSIEVLEWPIAGAWDPLRDPLSSLWSLLFLTSTRYAGFSALATPLRVRSQPSQTHRPAVILQSACLPDDGTGFSYWSHPCQPANHCPSLGPQHLLAIFPWPWLLLSTHIRHSDQEALVHPMWFCLNILTFKTSCKCIIGVSIELQEQLVQMLGAPLVMTQENKKPGNEPNVTGKMRANLQTWKTKGLRKLNQMGHGTWNS